MERPPVTLEGMRHGARLVLPVVPGITVFAAAFGTAAAQKGMSLLEAVLASALVYAGAAQLVRGHGRAVVGGPARHDDLDRGGGPLPRDVVAVAGLRFYRGRLAGRCGGRRLPAGGRRCLSPGSCPSTAGR